jgi:conjugal transfer pilus assembly protein TraB
MRAVLLAGLDAPTGGQAQNNPWPVVMRVQDNAFLPNRYRAKVKECHLLGSGYGDISSERAYLRLESISCVLNDGEVVDANAKGYVVGEDGKAGMRGRVISKQGQVLANALMTGIISGIGQGFQQSATTYSTSALGSVGTVDPGKQFQAGIGTGIGKALDRLSQYYITLAEKMFPVIEVDAGRVVDVVLTRGVTLGLGQSADEGDYSDIWKRGRQIMRKSLNPME